jgi:hypothetical protein
MTILDRFFSWLVDTTLLKGTAAFLSLCLGVTASIIGFVYVMSFLGPASGVVGMMLTLLVIATVVVAAMQGRF